MNNNSLVTKEQEKEIVSYLPEHKEMIEIINKNLPEIHRATSLFGKSQSQFMDNILTIGGALSGPTPIRNARQCLSEINKTKQALEEAFYNNKKKSIEAKILQRDSELEKDELKRELMIVKLEQKLSQIESSKIYISGAIRKITNYINQYNQILKECGKENFNEEDFEKEEERYHIMKSFDQALTAARAHNGMVDEGNHIYLNSIGINGATAAVDVARFLQLEGMMLQQGKEPPYDMVLDFLNKMADKYKGCSVSLSKKRGMTLNTKQALLKEGDKK